MGDPPPWLANEVQRVLQGRTETSHAQRHAFQAKCAGDPPHDADYVFPFCRLRLCKGEPDVVTSCNLTAVGLALNHDGVHGYLQAMMRALYILKALSPEPLETDLFVSVVDMILYSYASLVAAFNSYVGSPDVLLLPAEWQLTSVAHRYYGKIDQSDNIPWEDKLPVLFWRGSLSAPFSFWSSGEDEAPAPPSGCQLTSEHLYYHRPYNASSWLWHPRGRLCLLSTYTPLVDAKITSLSGLWPAGRRNVEELRAIQDDVQASLERGGVFGEHQPFEEFLRYRYLIVPDITDRLYYLLWINAVLFIPDSAVKQWGLAFLQPWRHYIPVKADLSDLLFQLDWARRHDDECRQIAERANKLSRQIFSPDYVFYYLYTLLRELQASSEPSCD